MEISSSPPPLKNMTHWQLGNGVESPDKLRQEADIHVCANIQQPNMSFMAAQTRHQG